MSDIQTNLLKSMCTGLGEGNSNIDKLTNKLIADFPEKEPGELKKEILEQLTEMVSSGQLQIVTTGWEIGKEFFYICSKRL
jgi:hypothetical protein